VAPFSSAVLILAAFFYGLFRVRGFHPVVNASYSEWLATTPWTPAKPLPLGPVQLVAADVLLLAAAWAAARPFSGAAAALVIVKMFLAAYSVGLMSALFRTGEWCAGYALWFGLGLMVLRWTFDGQFFVTAAVMYGIGMVGFRRSLGRFPLDSPGRIPAPPRGVTPLVMAVPGAVGKLLFGWPFGYLMPGKGNASLSRVHGTTISLLIGWTAYAACSIVPLEILSGTYGILFAFVLYGVLIRLAIYGIFENRPPISLAGRFGTGRWIIPEYDCVFVAPLAACLVAVLGVPATGRLGVTADIGLPAVLALFLFILLTFGPERRRWVLTAPIRFVPRSSMYRKTFWA
jgi:hypothetical protein